MLLQYNMLVYTIYVVLHIFALIWSELTFVQLHEKKVKIVHKIFMSLFITPQSYIDRDNFIIVLFFFRGSQRLSALTPIRKRWTPVLANLTLTAQENLHVITYTPIVTNALSNLKCTENLIYSSFQLDIFIHSRSGSHITKNILLQIDPDMCLWKAREKPSFF